MAARFWVTGGTGNWNNTSNWSATSGGASGASVPGSADTAAFDASSGAGTATLDISPVIQTLTCTGFTGTLAFGTNTISLNSTGTIFTGATTMTVTGTPLIICTDNSATARTITPGAVTEANSISFRITAGTGFFAITSNQAVRNLDFTDGVNPTGFAGTFSNLSNTIFGDFKASTGMIRSGTSILTFAATSGIKTINTAGVTFDFPFTFNGVGGTWQLQTALTSGATRTCTLTNGVLDLNGFTLSTGVFTINTTNATTLAFGVGNITLTGTGTIFNGSLNCTVTGTPQVICTNSSVTSRAINPGAVTEANSISFRVTAGTGPFGITAGNAVRNFDFTDGTNPTGYSGALGATAVTVYGNFKASTGMTQSPGGGTITFAATSGIKTVETAGVTFDRPITFNGVGGNWQLQSALTSGSTRTCTLTNGTLDLNGYTATFGAFSSTNSNVRTLAFGSTGKFVLLITSATAWTTATSTNLTVTGTNPLIQLTTNATTGTRTVSMGASGEANAISVDVTAGSDTIAFGGTNGAFKNVNFTGFTGTHAPTASILVFGSWNFGGVTAATGTATTTFAATSGANTITSNGRSFPANVTFSGVGGNWSLQDALTLNSTRTLTLTSGTLTTNGYAVTADVFSSSNTNVRTLNLGASTVTLVGGLGTTWNITTSTNMTLNAGTSSLVFTGTANAIFFQGGGLTYYDITLPTAAANNFNFIGTNTFRNITATNPISPGRRLLILNNTTTVTGVLSCSGSAANSRNRIVSLVTGVAASLVVNSVAAISDVDFADITLTGAAAPVSGTRLGNFGGNTGIVFGAGKTVYWNQPAGGLWSDVAWALTSGGTVGANNFPLAQDTVILDNTGVGSGSTINIQYGWAFDTFNASTLTNPLTVDWNSPTGGSTFIFGDVTLSSAITFTASAVTPLSFSGRRNGSFVTITSAGVSWPQSAFQINCVSPDTVRLGDNLVSTGAQFALLSGALDLNGNTVNCVTFDGSNANNSVRSIAFNAGNISVTGNNAIVWACEDLTNFSYTGTPTVNFTYSGSVGTRTINNGSTAGATESNAVDFNITAGSDTTAQTAASVVRNFNCTGYSGAGGLFGSGFIYGNLTLSSTQTITGSGNTTTFAATSGTKTIATNGVTIDRPLRFSGIGGAWSLQDALTVGATRDIQLLAGTLTTNGYAVSVGKFGGSIVTGDRTLNLGSSLITCFGTTGTNVSWQVVNGGFSYTVNAGTSTIYMAEPFSGASRQEFIGGGKTYYNVVYSGGQPGGFSDSNTFNSISNTAQPLTLSFEAGSTQTVNNFNVSGTAGNLVTLNSVTPGTQWSLAKNTGGKVLVSYVSITDSAATPAGYWFAPTSQGNIDGGNNTGWNFNSAGGVTSGFFPFF